MGTLRRGCHIEGGRPLGSVRLLTERIECFGVVADLTGFVKSRQAPPSAGCPRGDGVRTRHAVGGVLGVLDALDLHDVDLLGQSMGGSVVAHAADGLRSERMANWDQRIDHPEPGHRRRQRPGPASERICREPLSAAGRHDRPTSRITAALSWP